MPVMGVHTCGGKGELFGKSPGSDPQHGESVGRAGSECGLGVSILQLFVELD